MNSGSEPGNTEGVGTGSNAGFRVNLESVLVVSFFLILFIFSIVGGKPLFQSIVRMRLTLSTVFIFSFFVFIVIVFRKWHRLRRMIAEWWVIIGVLAVYESLKHLHANWITQLLGIVPKDGVMAAIDSFLFTKPLPFLMENWSDPWFIHIMWVFYIWVYYLWPVCVMGYLYFVTGDEIGFRRLRRGLVVVLLGGYIGYILVPVAGPLFTMGEQFSQPILTQPALKKLVFDTLRYNWDCFPSLHTAVPWLFTFLVWQRGSWWLRSLCVIAATGVTLSTVALRFHYGIDLVAGLAWAVAVAVLIEKTERYSWKMRIPEFFGSRINGS
ncbi:MAG: inositol phosphorylceramide synthase [Holophagae bacterium]|nr:inositol phosphorylceramide synthase [Holophagae bacterium]